MSLGLFATLSACTPLRWRHRASEALDLPFGLIDESLWIPSSDHYTCNICQQKGHWIQDCPEKEARDAERDAARKAGGHRGPAKPISRTFYRSSSDGARSQRHGADQLLASCVHGTYSRRVLVLPVESEGDEAPDRLDRDRNLCHVAQGPSLLDRFESRPRRRPRPHHPGQFCYLFASQPPPFLSESSPEISNF